MCDLITKFYSEILTSLCKQISGGVYKYYSNCCTLNPWLHISFNLQPPPDFKPPYTMTIPSFPENGWYYGQLRERQGVFCCQYVQFQYSRKLTSASKNLPTSLCTSDTVHLQEFYCLKCFLISPVPRLSLLRGGEHKLGTHAHWRTSIFKTAPVFFFGSIWL